MPRFNFENIPRDERLARHMESELIRQKGPIQTGNGGMKIDIMQAHISRMFHTWEGRDFFVFRFGGITDSVNIAIREIKTFEDIPWRFVEPDEIPDEMFQRLEKNTTKTRLDYIIENHNLKLDLDYTKKVMANYEKSRRNKGSGN